MIESANSKYPRGRKSGKFCIFQRYKLKTSDDIEASILLPHVHAVAEWAPLLAATWRSRFRNMGQDGAFYGLVKSLVL